MSFNEKSMSSNERIIIWISLQKEMAKVRVCEGLYCCLCPIKKIPFWGEIRRDG